MKLLARINWKKWLDSLWDKKTFAIAVVVVFLVSVPSSESVLAQNRTNLSEGKAPSSLSFLATQPKGLPEAVGSRQCSSTITGIYGQEIDQACCTGIFCDGLRAASEAVGGLDYGSYTYVSDSAVLTEAERQELYAEIMQRSSGSLLGAATSTTYALVDQRPASGLLFTEEVVAQTIYPDIAYAQTSSIQPYFPGTGFELLSPIRTLWGFLVSIAYSMMIILIVVVAFALMFRAKLDGNQAVQLQTAIPGIVMAMILIPLSYPISGLFIDGITLGANAVHGFLFGPIGPLNEVYEAESPNGLKGLNLTDEEIANGENRGFYLDDPRLNVFGFGNIVGLNGEDNRIADKIDNAVCSTLSQESTDCSTSVNNLAVGNIVKFLLSGFSTLVFEVLGLILFLVFQLLAFATGARIGWKLFKQFLTMMFLPMISPLIFASLAIPGRGNKLVIWYLKRMGNVTIVYIATYTLLLLSAAFATPAIVNILPQGTIDGLTNYEPPLIAGSLFGEVTNLGQAATGGVDGTFPIIFLLLSMGLYIITPGIMQQITDALAPKEENALAKLFSQEFGTTSQLAFRQAPAVIAQGGGAIYNNSIGAIGRRYGGGRVDNLMSATRSEKYVEDSRKAIQEARAAAADENAGVFSRIGSAAKAQALQTSGRFGTALLGQPGELTPKKGDAPASVAVRFENFNGLNPNSGGPGTQFSIRTQDASARGATFTGDIVMEVPDGASFPEGFVYFTDAGAGAIARLSNGKNDNFVMSLKKDTTPKKENGLIKITNPNMSFLGQNKVRIPVIISFTGANTVNALAGAWSGRPIEYSISADGETPVIKPAKLPFSINIYQ